MIHKTKSYSLLQSIKDFVKKLQPKKISPLQIEMDNLLRLYKRDCKILDDQLYQAYSTGACCPDCLFGHDRFKLIKKQKRRVQRLFWIVQKKIGQGPLPYYLHDMFERFPYNKT